MKAFKNRLEEMAEATVNALDYSDSKVEYPDISMVQKWPKEYHITLLKKALKEYEDSDDEPKKCKSVTVII